MANVSRYNPFNEVTSLRDAMDRLFEDSFISRGAGIVSNVASSSKRSLFLLLLIQSVLRPIMLMEC